MSTYQGLAPLTDQLESSIHGALDACDAYREFVEAEIERLEAEAEPNEKLIKRLRQFRARIESITTQLEDGVLDDLNFCTDRLFAVRATERGEFL